MSNTENHSLENFILKTDNLKKSYITGHVETHALRGIDIAIKRGEFVAVIGPSGSGKTTLLNITGILDEPTSGVVYIDGHNVANLRESEKTKFRLTKLGFVFQFFNLFPELNAVENVYLPLMLKGKSKRNCVTQATKLLKLVGLSERLDHYPSELSGGEQQRVSIARALANQPALILADEPTANLDSTTAEEIMSLFKRLNRDHNETILMVTHEKEFADQADRVIQLRDGNVVNEYQPDALEAGLA